MNYIRLREKYQRLLKRGDRAILVALKGEVQESRKLAVLRTEMSEYDDLILDLEVEIDRLIQIESVERESSKKEIKKVSYLKPSDQVVITIIDENCKDLWSECERELISQALLRFNGNRTKASKALGICIRTIRNKLKEYRSKGLVLEYEIQ